MLLGSRERWRFPLRVAQLSLLVTVPQPPLLYPATVMVLLGTPRVLLVSLLVCMPLPHPCSRGAARVPLVHPPGCLRMLPGSPHRGYPDGDMRGGRQTPACHNAPPQAHWS